jgi:D-arginine dehydrogenase
LKYADVIVLGAGMAGASVAAELAPGRRVLLLEMEEQPGLHATGRSAAMFFESYGNATVRALTRASREFFEQPPAGFADTPLLSPRGALFVADAARLSVLEAMIEADPATCAIGRSTQRRCVSNARCSAKTGRPVACSTKPVTTWTWRRSTSVT